MGDRKTLSVKVDEDVADNFRDFVHEKKGKIRGELGREVENAMREYMDRDRFARVEENQAETHELLNSVLGALSENSTTHTHTGDVKPMTVTEKRDLIAGKLRDREAPIMPERDVVDAIESVAGGDDRTIRKYMGSLRRSGKAFDHPSSDSTAWTTDAEQFATWALAEFESRPDASMRDILDAYAMDVREYEDLLDRAALAANKNR